MILLKGHKTRHEKIKSMKKPPIYNLDQVKSINQPNSRKRERTLGRKGKTTIKTQSFWPLGKKSMLSHLRNKGYDN